MPKANRYFVAGHHYHLTHRCHGRSFLLKFAKDRNAYRELPRRRIRDYRTPLLGYCITSNHIHLLVTAKNATGTGAFMDALQGDFAQRYNIRKKRSGSFWSGRYRATAVDSPHYLWNCLLYIDLNMVRAGVVRLPSEWPWCGFGELSGGKKRYRLIDREHFECATGQHPGTDGFIANYNAGIAERLSGEPASRNPAWAECLQLMANEKVLDPKLNPFAVWYWEQFGGGPTAADYERMDPTQPWPAPGAGKKRAGKAPAE